MTRERWSVLLALYALAALAVVFLGTSVPACFGDAAGQMSADCVARWEAGRSLIERFVEALGWPAAAALTFFGLTAATLIVDLGRRRRMPDGE